VSIVSLNCSTGLSNWKQWLNKFEQFEIFENAGKQLQQLGNNVLKCLQSQGPTAGFQTILIYPIAFGLPATVPYIGSRKVHMYCCIVSIKVHMYWFIEGHMYWRNVQGLRVKAFVVCGLLFVVCCFVFVHELKRQLKQQRAYILRIQTTNCLVVCLFACLFVCLSVCLFICLFYLFGCLFECLFNLCLF